MQFVLENECDDMATSGKRIADVGGGFTDDPFDMGGSTVYGLSRAIRYRESLMPVDLKIASFSNADLKTTTRSNAEKVYHKIYWVKFGYDRIVNQGVSTKIMDSAVNLNWPKGTYRIPAHLLAQIACNSLGAALTLDGSLGPKTVDALNGEDPQRFLAAMVGGLVRWYEGIIHDNPSQDHWRGIWMHRARRTH